MERIPYGKYVKEFREKAVSSEKIPPYLFFFHAEKDIDTPH